MPIDPCPTCGSRLYHRLRYVPGKNGLSSYCSDCAHIPMTPCYDDIYLGGSGLKTDPNIVDPKTLREIPFQTKQDKAIAMKIAGVKQSVSAERQHGYRNEMYLHRKTYFGA